MKQYVRSDGIQAEAVQFKGVEEVGNDGVFDLLTLIEQFGMKGVWEPVRHTDEWFENVETGEPEEIVTPERIMLFGTNTSVNENEEVITEIVELVPANRGDYFIRRDGDLYVMAEELFESIWSVAITTDLEEWEWVLTERLPYSKKVGFWRNKITPDAVSKDGGVSYFLLSERPKYSEYGHVYLSKTPIKKEA